MITRRFGRTNLQMPVLTCGGMRYQQGWKDLDPTEIDAKGQENLRATVWRAFELGINHIETARGYGSSEMQLGWVLPDLPREKLIVQTKVGPAPAKEFLKRFDQSMRYLKLDHVELLSLHGVNNQEIVDDALKPGGALSAARQLQREGRVKFIGFSTHAPVAAIQFAINTGEFDYVNLHWYFVNDFNWPAIQDATRQDMGVFIISPNDKGGKLYAPPAKLARLCAPLTPMIFNDLYCLLRPEVHTLSIGASRPGDFDEHVRAVELFDRAAELVAPVEQRLRAAMAEAAGEAWSRGWWETLPEFHDVPGEINLLEILRLWTLAKSLDLVEFGKMRYNLLGNGSHWFPGHNAADFDEAALAPLLKNSPFRDRIPLILREAHTMLAGEAKKRLSES